MLLLLLLVVCEGVGVLDMDAETTGRLRILQGMVPRDAVANA